MSSEKYIGLDVHQATISVAVVDSQGTLIMESILETKGLTLLEFFAGARQPVRNLRRTHLGRLALRSTQAACDRGPGVQSTKDCAAQTRQQE